MESGTQLGHYQILSPLGRGGMGEVWQARDTKLGRDVAIKMLPEQFAKNEDRLARFSREAKLLASLNHPSIAAIYGLEEHNGTRFLVLELVPGETLAGRLKRDAMTVVESLEIALQIAEALEAAHDKNIIHRDLKPANIKVTDENKVKVLDFGLAKVLDDVPPEAGVSNSPTMSMASTAQGMILGTAAYMSPELAKGKDAERTSDLWAFGCVLYEMLTGRAVFEGETVHEILHNVLKVEPEWRRLPTETPAGIRRLLHRCLRKDPRLRLRDARDAYMEIAEAQTEPALVGQVAPKASRRRERLMWAALAVVTLIAVVQSLWVRWSVPGVPSAPEMRLEINTPATTDPVSLAISPDGQKIVFVATSEGRPHLWLRLLDSVSPRALAGTEYASFPFWSPDSRSVGFFADGKLKRIDIDGGSVKDLARAIVPAGGTWNRDGVILFQLVPDGGLFRTSATGGEPVPMTQMEPQGTGHRAPQFLPDGRHFLYYVMGDQQARGIYLGEIGGTGSRRLLDADTPGVYVSSGHILLVEQGTLYAQSIDPVHLQLVGIPHPVAEQVTFGGVAGIAALSASVAGPIAYRTGASVGKRQMVWFDRSGREIGKLGAPESFGPAYPSISHDNRLLAEQRTISGNTDIWLLDLFRDVAIRFTSDPRPDIAPIWSPHDDRIVYSSVGKDGFDLYQKPVTGTASEKLLETPQSKQATDWSPDGRFLLYRSLDPKSDWDIWALPLDGDRKPFPVVRTGFEERDGQFSPDGKWIAYQSNESGRFEIYVQAFPGPGVRSLISTYGGAQVRWRHDGKELFYIALDGQLMAVPFRLASNGKTVETGAPVPLFTARVGAVQDIAPPHYIVSPDGQRFLMDTVVEEAASPITVLLNWKAPSK